MARKVKFNPTEARKIGLDVERIVQSSGAAIDAIFDEHDEQQRELRYAEDILANVQEAGRPVPQGLRIQIREIRSNLKRLDAQKASYGRVAIKDLKDRLTVVKYSPEASLHKRAAREVERGIFRLEEMNKRRGVDLRRHVNKLRAAMLTLEQDVGAAVYKEHKERFGPKRGKTKKQVRQEAALIDLAQEWKGLYPHVKKFPRFSDDVKHIRAQLRVLDRRYRAGEDVSGDAARLAKKVRDLKGLTRSRPGLMTYEEARERIHELADEIKAYSEGAATQAGIDRLKRKVDEFGGSISTRAKAEWKKVDARSFASLMRKLRVKLERMGKGKPNPKRKTKKKATRKTTPEPARLIRQCQRHWEHYCARPGKRRLGELFEHLERMKESKSKKVAEERKRCLRAANVEAKRLRMK